MSYAMEAIGWTLIHFCWQAAAIALLYRLADAFLSRSRSQVRYVAALAAILAMLAAAAVTLIYEVGGKAAANSHDRAAFVRLQVNEHASAPTTSGVDLTATTPDPGVPILAAFDDAVQARVRAVMPWLDALWLLGVLCLSVRTIGGWWLIQRLRRSSLVNVPAHVRASFERLARRIGIEKAVDLRISERISGPLAMGVLKSVVLLPASALTALSPEQLEVVLAHELAHIRRADYLWNILQTMVETLFFFHPAVWWVSGNLRRQRELCCDDAALECCADPLIYATALLRLEEDRSSRLRLAMALDGHESCGLRARIARILNETGETTERRRDVVPFSLIGVCAIMGFLLLAAPRVLADLSVDQSTRIQGPTPVLASTVALPPEPRIAGNPNADAVRPTVQTATPAPKPAPVHQAQVAPTAPESAPAPVAAPVPVVAPAPIAVIAPAVRVPVVTDAPKIVIDEAIRNAMARVPAAIAAVAPFVAQDRGAGQSSGSQAATKGDYIDQMRAAGYNVDLDKYVAMKIQGVTPEYARSMATTGFGKPSADDLIAMKIHGVDPGEVAELKSAGIDPGSYQDLITYRIFKVTPEYVAGIKAAGFSDLPAKRLVELRIQNVTPEFAKATKQQWPDATVDQLVQLRIFNINQAFIASAKRHGLEPLTIEKLVRLRISGLIDDESPRAENSR